MPRSRPTTTPMRASFIWDDLHEVRDMRHVFGRGFFVGGAFAGDVNTDQGSHQPRHPRPPNPTTRVRCSLVTTRTRRSPHDGKLTFDRLSSVFAAGQPDA